MEALQQGSFFGASQNKYNKSYAMIKTEQKVVSQEVFKTAQKLHERVHFSKLVEMSTISPMLRSKLNKSLVSQWVSMKLH